MKKGKKCSVKARKAIKTLKNNAWQRQREALLVGGFKPSVTGFVTPTGEFEFRDDLQNVSDRVAIPDRLVA